MAKIIEVIPKRTRMTKLLCKFIPPINNSICPMMKILENFNMCRFSCESLWNILDIFAVNTSSLNDRFFDRETLRFSLTDKPFCTLLFFLVFALFAHLVSLFNICHSSKIFYLTKLFIVRYYSSREKTNAMKKEYHTHA